MGHRDVWSYTPRQVSGFLFLANRRTRAEAARDLGMGMAAARGDPKKVQKQIRELQK